MNDWLTHAENWVFILIALLVTGILGKLLWPLLGLVLALLLPLSGLNAMQFQLILKALT